MASSKDAQPSRPLSQHRPSSSTAPLNVPNRLTPSRNHSHSVSLGTLGTQHRVTRRKSMTSNNLTSVAAAVQAIDLASLEALAAVDGSKNGLNGIQRAESSSTIRPASSYMHKQGSVEEQFAPRYLAVDSRAKAEGESAIAEESESGSTNVPASKVKARRASEGQYLTKTEGKRASGELRCEKCGKGYKHSSCLTKHLWEHTPEWSFTSKLLISKHQQVQLLEAASVLITMNQDGPGETVRGVESDNSSASPAASGSSDVQDYDSSSVETTPPPYNDHAESASRSEMRESKRYSTTSSVFSRSYQSGFAGSAPSVASYGSYGQSGFRRPSTSGQSAPSLNLDDDHAGLASAVELCNFGTPRTGATYMNDIPPVPPLPARYASHNANLSIGGSHQLFGQDLNVLPSLSHRISDERDGKRHSMSQLMDEDDDFYQQHRTQSGHRAEEYDDGVFGTMEE